mmetsp:Transcript_34324/g.51244  ORF Transcript_34324/g.51244 Transcript_34324/m.51244 type:complete len:123 (+) Transcript_34324:897-1265(+)
MSFVKASRRNTTHNINILHNNIEDMDVGVYKLTGPNIGAKVKNALVIACRIRFSVTAPILVEMATGTPDFSRSSGIMRTTVARILHSPPRDEKSKQKIRFCFTINCSFVTFCFSGSCYGRKC